ncbi:MAG: hypothetical protein LLF76_09260 [Planctomycetaceae bacterium]|nr:hypothetical protein [Planctomycetaceae bacterium]
MKKNIVQWCLGLSAYIALCLFGFILYPSVLHIHILLSVICVCAVMNSIAFFVSYGILRKLKEFAFWKFAVYLVLIVAPSTIISGISTDLSQNFFVARDNFYILRPDIRPDPQMFLIFFAFVLLAALNFVLWRALFNTTLRQAVLLGLLVGFFNTVACFVATPIVKCL